MALKDGMKRNERMKPLPRNTNKLKPSIEKMPAKIGSGSKIELMPRKITGTSPARKLRQGPKPLAPKKIVKDPTKPMPKATPKLDAEQILKRKMKQGKVTDLNKTRQSIAKKTGVWPNGYTN